MNPLYEALRSARPADAEQHRLRKINLDRLRALPAELGERYVLVDAASAMLSMVQGGRAVGTMRVVVGKPAMATPTLAGLIRYATLSPYWNLPPDLSAERARRIMAEGPTLLDAQRLEVVSGWQADAQPVDPALVDWTSLATGQGGMRLRQLPGERNVMGAVKFMLPNPLGIYLHDTPDKWAFDRAARRLSSGCVRLQDAAQLGAWLFGGSMPSPSGIPEERVDLARPVPVYIVYLTAVAEDGRVATRPDPYRRDALS
jgi:murein L,D-transpeptidase YcbB/YkuD